MKKDFDCVRYDKIAENKQAQFKEATILLDGIIEMLAPGRAKALAATKLEECYMWVGKAIRDDQIQRNGFALLEERRKDG